MALVLKDRVKETSTTAGTGTITLAGAVAGFQSFSAVGNGNTTYYAIVDPITGDWEVGIGTYTSSGTTLSRTTVLSSSSGGSLVSFAANAKDVFVTYPSEKGVWTDASGVVNATSFGAITATSAALTSGTITTAPVNATDIVNKEYADSIASGLNYHQPVNYASTTTLPTYTYNNGASGVGATITAVANGALSLGGGSPTATQRVLVKDEIGGNAPYNGVYVVTQAGTSLLPFILTRATDYDTSGSGTNEIDQGDYVLVISGTLASTAWVQQTPLPITVGTTALSFLQFNAPITYSAGTGLNLSPATTFNISNTGVSASTYGSASAVPVFAVNAQGQITSVTNTNIAINGSAVSGNISGSAGSVANSLTAGTYLTGTAFNGSAAQTWTVDATSANTASKVVARDASGNFSAGTITATLNGSATSTTTATNLAGGAANQIPYQTASGTTAFMTAASGTNYVLNFNGSAFTWVSGTISGVPLGSNLNSLTAGTYLTGTAYNGSAAQTFAVDATSANTASKVVARDASGNFSAGTITASLSGNASTASQLNNSLTLATSGTGLSGSATFNGSSAQTFTVTSNATSANTASTIVARDGSGNFSAGTITASLSGNATTATTATNQSGGTVNATTGSFSGTLTGTAALFSGQGRFGGWYTTGSGAAVEVGISSAEGYVIGYNRTANAYLPLNLQGDSASIRFSGSTVNVNSGALQQGGSQVLTAANYNSYAPTLTGTGASGTWSINITGSAGSTSGNAATATTLIGDQTNWASYRSSAVANMLGWKNYGNGHVIFDASNGTSPTGSAVSNTDSGTAWSATYPTLMGWNGYNTYGVRVDRARQADYLYSSTSAYATIYYDYDNTSYYVDPASTTYLYSLQLSGNTYFQPNNWIQFNGNYGIYWPSTGFSGAPHLYPNTGGSYTQFRLDGYKNSYGGIWDSYSGVNGIMYDSGGNGGIYREANGRWYLYYHVGNDCMGIGTSSNSSTYSLYLNKGVYAQSRIDATIFYDTNNTSYYLDPASSSVLNTIYQAGVYTRNAAGAGYLSGNYPSTETSSTTGAIYTIGGSYYPTSASLYTMYGIGYTLGNAASIGWVGQWGLYVAAAGTARHFLDAETGTGYASGSYRAPIFYDYNDTSYYVDPASTSDSALRMRGGALFGPNTSWGQYLYVGGNGNNDVNTATIAATNGNLHLDARNGYVMYLNNYATSSYTIVAQSCRSPIFYDYDNTSYYLDPASTSNLNAANFAGSSSFTASSYCAFMYGNGNTAAVSSVGLQVYSTGANGATMAFHRGGYYAINMGLDSDNVIRIGGWSASANRLQMDMSGNLTMAGNVTAYSDERLKKDWALLPDGFIQALAQVKSGTYTRIDSEERQVGVSAQGLREFLEEAVQTDAEGMLSVNYGGAALASAVELAKYVTALEQRISQLEARL